jgi:arsenate reductase
MRSRHSSQQLALRGLLLHHPRCSKSRAALDLLRTAGADFDIRDMIASPLQNTELKAIGRRLREPPLRWCRTDEPVWATRFEADDESAYDALATYPELMQRPIFLRGPFAVLARPADLVLALLGDDLPSTATAATYHEVYRIDTHGGQARVALVPSRESAQLLADHYEAKGHHQGYFVRPVCVPGPVSIHSQANYGTMRARAE